MESGGKCQRDKIHCNGFDNFPYRKSDVICISSSGSFPCTWNSGKIRGRILSWSIQDPGQQNGEVSITGENAHAWVEVYFDGVGWKAVDVTPGYYYNVATLQKMVNTPEQIKKNAALKNNGYKGKQTASSGKVIRILQRQIFGLLGIFGIEIKLGWKTKEMDQKITDNFANIEVGEYERACELVEKTIYGEIKLELFEERTVRNFRDKLAEEAKGLAWKEKLKLRYQFQKYCM